MPVAPYVHVTYTVYCQKCSVVFTMLQDLLPWMERLHINLPDDWHVVDDKAYCPAHDLASILKGE